MLKSIHIVKRVLSSIWRRMGVVLPFVVIGTVDVAVQYLFLDVIRHSVFNIMILALAKGIKWAMMFLVVREILGRFSRFVLVPLFLASLVLVSVEVFARVTFSMGIGGGWYTLLMTSSVEELRAFVCSLCTIKGACSVGLLVIVAVVGAWFVNSAAMVKRSVCVLIAATACFGAINFTLGQVGFDCSYIYWVRNTLHDRKIYNANRKCLSPDIPSNITCKHLDKRPIVVYVVGESATRNNMGAYGYKRETTPFLSSSDCILLRNMNTPVAATSHALRCLMTNVTIDNLDQIEVTLPALMRFAGFFCTFISNQGRWGMVESFESMLFASCHKSLYVTSFGFKPPIYDDVINPILKDSLQNNTNKADAVFIHLSGSHTPFDQRCPKGKELFKLSSIPPGECDVENRSKVNAYDNSIVFTDYVLSCFVETLKATGRPSVLFYISDHGESPRAKSWRYASSRDCWEVPAFFWFSQSYKDMMPEMESMLRGVEWLPLQSDWLMPGIAKIFGIDGYLGMKNIFYSKEFKPKKRVREFQDEK